MVLMGVEDLDRAMRELMSRRVRERAVRSGVERSAPPLFSCAAALCDLEREALIADTTMKGTRMVSEPQAEANHRNAQEVDRPAYGGGEALQLCRRHHSRRLPRLRDGDLPRPSPRIPGGDRAGHHGGGGIARAAGRARMAASAPGWKPLPVRGGVRRDASWIPPFGEHPLDIPFHSPNREVARFLPGIRRNFARAARAILSCPLLEP